MIRVNESLEFEVAGLTGLDSPMFFEHKVTAKDHLSAVEAAKAKLVRDLSSFYVVDEDKVKVHRCHLLTPQDELFIDEAPSLLAKGA